MVDKKVGSIVMLGAHYHLISNSFTHVPLHGFSVALYKQPPDLPPCYGRSLSWHTGTDPGAVTRPVTQMGREWNNLSSGECKSQPKDTAEVLVGEGGGGVKPLIVSPG